MAPELQVGRGQIDDQFSVVVPLAGKGFFLFFFFTFIFKHMSVCVCVCVCVCARARACVCVFVGRAGTCERVLFLAFFVSLFLPKGPNAVDGM